MIVYESEARRQEAQAIFDKVVTHLRTQNACSLNKYGCAYRGEDGLKCAVGCLIEDSEYNPDMEMLIVGALLARASMKGTPLHDRLAPHPQLLADLQHVHDHYTVDLWEELFGQLAVKHNLTLTPKNA